MKNESALRVTFALLMWSRSHAVRVCGEWGANTERQRDRETERQRDRETDRQRERDRQTDRQRERDRQTHRQTHRHTHIHTRTNTQIHIHTHQCWEKSILRFGGTDCAAYSSARTRSMPSFARDFRRRCKSGQHKGKIDMNAQKGCCCCCCCCCRMEESGMHTPCVQETQHKPSLLPLCPSGQALQLLTSLHEHTHARVQAGRMRCARSRVAAFQCALLLFLFCLFVGQLATVPLSSSSFCVRGGRLMVMR